jgi:TonB family protein
MFRLLISFTLIVCFNTLDAQMLGFNINGIYNKPVTQSQLLIAETLKDINPGFPASWVGSYKSVKVMLINGSDTTMTRSHDDKLSSEQKTLMSKLNMGEKIAVEVKYTPHGNSLDGKEIKTMQFTYTVAPEREAEFESGYMGLKNYLSDYALSKISLLVYNQMETAIIKFTINENGNTVDAHIDQSTKNKDVDELLLNAICNMPKWKPALNRHGKKISQDFQFRAGTEVGC